MGDKITLNALVKMADNNPIAGNKNGKLDGEAEIKFFEWNAKKEGYSEEEIQKFKEENGLAVKVTTNPVETKAKKAEVVAAPALTTTAKSGNKKYDELLPNFRAEVDKAVNENKIPEYKKIVDRIEAGLKTNDKETKEAVKMLRDRAKREAYAKAVEINSGNIGKTKGKRRAAMREMSKDEYFRDAIQDIKLDRKVRARGETFEARREEIADVTKEELNKELSKHFLGMRAGGGEKLANKLGYYKKADGKYNLQELSDDVLSRIGFNYKADRNDGDKEMSEIYNLKQHLEYKTGKKFTDNETKRLVKYVDAKVGHKKRTLVEFAKNLLAGEAVGISSGALGGYMAKHGDLNVTQTTNVTVDVNQSQSIINQFDAAGVEYTVSKASDGISVVINILQQVIKNDRQLNAIMGALGGAAIGAIPALAYLAFGGNTSEKSCVSVSDYSIKEKKYTDINQFKKYVDQRFGHNPVKADAMKQLAQICYEQTKDNKDGLKWHEVFQEIVREMAGIGSKLNPEECLGFKYKALETPKKPQETTIVQEQTKTYQVSDRCSDDEERTEKVEKPEVEKVAWETLAARYDCLDLPLGYKTRLVKVMQSVNNDDYTLQNLKKLTDISLSIKPRKKLDKMTPAEKEALKNEIRAKFQGVQGFDVEDYINNFFANTIGKQKVPTIMINDNTKCDYNPDITHNVKFVNGKPSGKSGHAGDEKTYTILGNKTAEIRTSDGQVFKYSNGQQAEFKKKIEELNSLDYTGSGNADCYEAGK